MQANNKHQELEDLNQVMQNRREKLERLREIGVNPYPYKFRRTHSSRAILNDADKVMGKNVSVAGRLMSIRGHGKASFAHAIDSEGKIQIYVRKDQVGDKNYEVFELLDIGDIIGISGEVFVTRTGETTIKVSDLQLLSKTLRPLPIVKEKVEGEEKVVYDQFADLEQRYRQRYVDLVVNPDVRKVFETRAKIISTMRKFLDDKGYLEVETPILQPIYGGASARPFVTHHNTLDIDLYLRIADELYLKRLIVGGFDGVYEISKDFRNEGMDRFHNPEFTMMELYVAFEDYHFMMDLVEEMISSIANEVLGTSKLSHHGEEIDLSPPWRRAKLFDLVKEYTGKNLYGKNLEDLRKAAEDLDVKTETFWREGKLIDEIFSERVEPHLVQPTFVTDYPVELSPLAKRHRDDPRLVERFEPFLTGREIGNAFSELNDPLDQRERFLAQKQLADLGDEEAQMLDEDYLRALEYGMPPTAGLGIGIDRLVMLFTDQPSIRDVIFFPQMRPEGK
ncbi:lysine--tRNA ligase [candidate division KSB1 bacterium]|nr:lysine--tRNA ligase [candidate division KSB1 bacterium]NIR69571.1 lysine--tRNA ligase [candidate division KSB1 bacterium]NIS25919.1 lysine--tRNA ligase [candidate division KSB1 bacterium]NIT72800.1 lysine--tRNA ligase [candidate division KSB1 bacterium]NIU26607.1 lysine--tRNA ligase [candidate division KSB1 bacterium]